MAHICLVLSPHQIGDLYLGMVCPLMTSDKAATHHDVQIPQYFARLDEMHVDQMETKIY